MTKKLSKTLRYRMLAFTLVCLFLLSIFVPLYHVNAGPGDWWNSNWLYRKKITIDYTKVAVDLTNFPALVDISDSDLASKAQNDGDDIVFTDEFAYKFDHEIEFYNNGAGRLIAWVEIPSLSSTVNTVLYMYYGNPGATNQQNVVSTWDASYVMVQHLKEATGLFYDSTSNDNDGTAYGTISRNITGKLDGAVSFDANHDDYIDCGSKTSLNFGTGSFAVSLWINANAQPADYYALLKKNRVSDGEWGFGIRSGPSTIGRDSLQFGVYDGTGASGSKIISSSAGILNNAWRYVVAERDGDTLRLFIDGVQVNSTTGAGAITVSTPDSFWIARHAATQWYIGKMDEVRLSSSARSANWISTEYNNQANPSSFYSIGTEEAHDIQWPTVSSPSPANGATDVTISLSKLSFHLLDYQNDSMNYYVTTEPDIGSGHETGVFNGTYEVEISGLQRNTTYTWHVNVTDPSGSGQWNNQTYTFKTIENLRLLSSSPETRTTIDRGTTQSFQVSYNSPATTTWYLDGNPIQTDTNQQSASMSHKFSSLGIYNVTAFGNDGTDSVKQEWSVQVIVNFAGGVVERVHTNFGPSQAWELGWVWDTALWIENGTYQMLYSGGPIGQRKVGYAWSNDGFTWTKYAGNPILSTVPGTWEEKEVCACFHVLKIDGVYWVYYNGFNNANQPGTGLARGTDITNLTRYANNPIVSDTYEMTVARINETLWIAYNGYRVINFLNSSDGIHWNYVQRNVMPSGGGWGGTSLYQAYMLFLNGTMYLTCQEDIDGGVLYCRFGEWTNLTRSPYNPILPHGTGADAHTPAPHFFYNSTVDAFDVYYCYAESYGGTGPSGLGFGRIYNVEGVNTAPTISNTSPSNGTTNVAISTSTVSFDLSDVQGDNMNYSVTTSPNVGTGTGTNVSNGRFNTSIGGLSYSTTYTWIVSTTDGQLWRNETFTFTTEPNPFFNPYEDGWMYRKKIVVNHTRVVGDQTDFPVLVDIADLDLASKAQPDGDDILFMNGTGEALKLKYEIESYNSTTGKLVAWVKIPSLSSSTDTVLYIYYGNPSSPVQQNPTATWDYNFMIVEHLKETSGTHHDSTTYNNDGTPSGVLQGILGKIDGADSFDGANDYVEIYNAPSLNPTRVTLEAWIRPNTVSGVRPIVEKYDWVAGKGSYNIRQNDAGLSFLLLRGITDPPPGVIVSNVLQVGNWYYIVGTYDGSTIKLYINGVLAGQTSFIGDIWPSDQTLKIGTRGNDKTPTSSFFSGMIDEVCLSNIARSNGWIATRYNNQYAPSSFYTVFGEEKKGPPEILVSPPTTHANLGSDYVVYVNVTSVEDLYAWEFQLNYNPSILDLTSTSVITGGLNEPTQIFYSLTDEITGHLWWAVSSTYPATTGISYTEHAIFRLTFHAIGVGTSDLELYGTYLSYSNGSEMVHTVVNGSIIVSAPDLTVTSITIVNNGCSIYKNDTDSPGNPYYYPVEVRITNTGNSDTASFYVKLEAYWINGSSLEAQQEIFVSGLSQGTSVVVDFTALFHPMQTGYFRLTATVDSRNDITESNETNNLGVQDNIRVTVMGDLNNDGVVDILDGVRISLAWGATPSDPWWNVKADLDHNGVVDIVDATRASLHWGETI